MANGIANCEPIIIGDTIFALFNDNVIKKLAKNPIDNGKQKSGTQYFYQVFQISKMVEDIRKLLTFSNCP